VNAFGISGSISQDLTLSEAATGFPYVIIGELTVADNYVLTIPPGEVVKFSGGSARLVSYGTLQAQGTSSQNIVFTSFLDDIYGGDLNGDTTATSPSPGDWAGIYLYGASDNDGKGLFEHYRIRYAGNWINGYASIYYYGSDSAVLKHSVVEYSQYDGIRSLSSPMLLRNDTIRDNNRYGIYISGSPVPDLGQNTLYGAGQNTFINNDGGNFQLYNSSPLPVDACYNDWGYYTEAEIDAHIYDDDESGSSGQVHFNPWYDPANPPFVVSFGADTLSGEAPLSVHFTDSTLLNPVAWAWDFENDGNYDAYDQNPEWMYFTGGTYSVKLKASNGVITDSLTKTEYITVSPNQHLRSYALDFDGLDDYAAVANIPYPEDLTIEAWIRPEHFNDYQEIVFFSGDHTVQFRLDPDSRIVFGENAYGNWNYVVSDTGHIYLLHWNHLAVTRAGDQVTLYINGVHAGFAQFDNNPVVSSLYFGIRSNAMDRHFQGLIDEVRIWSVARSQEEIQANLVSYLAGTETGLLAYYRMNDVAGQQVADLTGHGYDAWLGSTPFADVNDPAWIPTSWPYDTYLLADFSATPLSGVVPLEVHFTDYSMGSPASWQWDFENDGVVDSYEEDPVFTYSNTGYYSVKLIVADAKATDTIIKYDYVFVDYPAPISIEAARQLPQGTLVTIEGIVTSGPEYGSLKFIQDATGGMALYGTELSYFRMGDEVRVTGELTDYFGLLELTNFSQYLLLSSGNPLPAPESISVSQLGEQYESKMVRLDQVVFVDGGNAFNSATNYFLSDGSGSTYLRLHANSDLLNQRIPDLPVSLVGICVHFNGNPAAPYCIYGRDYNDLVYTDISGWTRQASGFSKRYSMINSMCAADQQVVWATAYDVKGLSTVNEVTRTTDGGTTWQTAFIPNSEGLFKASVYALNADRAWVVAYLQSGSNPQGIYATTDGGITWAHQSTAIFDINLGGFPNMVYFWDASTGVCMGDPTNGYFEIYTTGDGGNNWNRVSQADIPDPLPGEYGFIDGYTATWNTLRFTTNMGRLYSTTDFGATWSVQQTPLDNFFQVEFRDEDHGLILQQGSLDLYATSDGGNSWQVVNYTGPVRASDLKYVPGTPETYVSTGTNGFNAGISITTDGGSNWEYFPETHGLHAGATDWVDSNTGWFGANNLDASEGGVWKYAYTPAISVSLKVYLEGPFNTGTSLMETGLNNNHHLPLSQPYQGAPWNYNGPESVTAIPNADVVDWVLVELRDAISASLATPSTIVARQAGFLLKDGSVTSLDGYSPLDFNLTVVNQLFAVIWHRNHLGVMSSEGIPSVSNAYSYDFTPAAGQAYGGINGHKQLATGLWGMVSGDGNADRQVSNTDKVDIWKVQSGSSGYKEGDFNLNGQVDNVDKIDKWRPNSGRSCQVPI
jgi:PKD repeat protein